MERKERLRKITLKRKLLSEKRFIEKFFIGKTSVNDFFREKIIQYKELPAVTDEYNNLNLTYEEVDNQMQLLASAMQSFGIKKGDFVGVFTENQGRWCICQQAVLRCGAVATLRGSNAPIEELDYIMGHSETKGIIVRDDSLLKKLAPCLNNHKLNFVIVMFRKNNDAIEGLEVPVYSFEEALEIGVKSDFVKPEQTLDDSCIMLYTSGTTGNPKGVLLTHKNIISQFPSIEVAFCSKKGENTLQILPVWHSYENIAQMSFFIAGCHLHFTTLAGLKNDLAKYKIDAMMSVPRVWEAIRLNIYQKLKRKSHIKYRLFDNAVKLSIIYKIHKMYSERRLVNKQTKYKTLSNWYHKFVRTFLKPFHILATKTLYASVKRKAGINFRMALSGGGSLSMKDQLFFDAIGVNLREGYGLTETSPILTMRYANDVNFLGSCGKPFMATELKIVDIETRKELGIFRKGVLYARGPQVMKGYYKDEAATKAVLDEDGWFNTGDIGWLTGDNNLVLVGRMKETIVLSNGENIEPIPIEEACLQSPYIEQIVLVGQDESSLGALVVPSEAALEKCGILAQDLKSGKTLSIKDQTLRDLIKKEISTYIKNKKNLQPFENIKQFELLKENFNMSNGLMSQTSKIKRNRIFERYQQIISNMFDKKQ